MLYRAVTQIFLGGTNKHQNLSKSACTPMHSQMIVPVLKILFLGQALPVVEEAVLPAFSTTPSSILLYLFAAARKFNNVSMEFAELHY